MALHPMISVLLFALALSAIEPSTCQVVKGKVSCLDCSSHYDFSGIKVQVKCDQVKKLANTAAESNGSFEVELPTGTSSRTRSPLNCLAKLVGGPTRLYASRKNMVSEIVEAHDSSSYTISTPLAFSIACPENAEKCGLISSKTIDLPLPKEWGLAPSSYYVPFFPIIGIP